VVQQDFAAGRKEDGGVVESLSEPLDQTRGDVDSVRPGCLRQPGGVGAGDRLSQVTCRGVSPAQVQALGEDHKPAALDSSLADGFLGPVQVGRGPASFDQDLSQPNSIARHSCTSIPFCAEIAREPVSCPFGRLLLLFNLALNPLPNPTLNLDPSLLLARQSKNEGTRSISGS